ncbi:MAG: NfeD family protein [Clostridia bacterium]|nr:NfeD family protein [Clostridia bacterium]
MSYEVIWIILCGFCLIAEIFTVSFLLFFPGIAAFIAFLLALFNCSLTVQIIAFIACTILMIIFIRPLVCKVFKSKDVATNSNALIGKTGVVLKEINKDLSPGQVKITGEIWSAISSEGKVILKDSLVTVVGISGVKLLVEEKNEEV